MKYQLKLKYVPLNLSVCMASAFLTGDLLIIVTHRIETIVSHDCGSIDVLIMHRRLDIRASEKAQQQIFAPGPPERLIWLWMNF